MGKSIYNSNAIQVMLNNNGTTVGNDNDRIWVATDDEFGSLLTADDARRLGEAMYKAADALEEYQEAYAEAHAQKLPTRIGAVIRHRIRSNTYVRTGVNTWLGITSNVRDMPDVVFGNPELYEVLYEGPEA